MNEKLLQKGVAATVAGLSGSVSSGCGRVGIRAGRCATLVSCAFDSGASDDLGSDPHEIPQNGARSLLLPPGSKPPPNG